MSGSPDITAMLAALRRGDQTAVAHLAPLVYQELRRIAAAHFRRERREHTLEPTALVHEAYMRLVDQRDVTWQNRAHFFGVASQTMRRVLVDHARRRSRSKRGGLQARVTLDDERVGPVERDLDLIALDDALHDLASVDPQLCRIVELRYFGGLTIEETAEALGVSTKTIDRAWSTARAWLRRYLTAQ